MKRKTSKSDREELKRIRTEGLIERRKDRRFRWLLQYSMQVSRVLPEFFEEVFGDYFDFTIPDIHLEYPIVHVLARYCSYKRMIQTTDRVFWKKSVFYARYWERINLVNIEVSSSDSLRRLFSSSDQIVHVFDIIYGQLIEYLDHKSLRVFINTYDKCSKYTFLNEMVKITCPVQIKNKICEKLELKDDEELKNWLDNHEDFRAAFKETVTDFRKYSLKIDVMSNIINMGLDERIRFLQNRIFDYGYIFLKSAASEEFLQKNKYFSNEKLAAYLIVKLETGIEFQNVDDSNYYINELNIYVETFGRSWRSACAQIIHELRY
jgi:DNA-binding transcriptional MerR regulator